MNDRQLPSELIALVHHVELNKSGWWHKSLCRIVLALMADGAVKRLTDLETQLRDQLGLSLPQATIAKALAELQARGDLVAIAHDEVKVAEKTRIEITKEGEEGRRLDESAFRAFSELLVKECPGLEPKHTWEAFCGKFLLPLIRSLGASAYQLIASEGLVGDHVNLETFLKEMPPDDAVALRRVVNGFLIPGRPEVRSFVLAHLNAHFFIMATSLSKDNLDALSSALAKRPRFHIFVDTNTLFSLLGLHENPANQATSSLVELLAGIRERVDTRLYVTRPTLDEARRALVAARIELGRISLARNVVSGIPDHELGGIAQTFFENARRTPSLSADAYFSPYIDNLITIARQKGIELYNESLDHLSTDQAVIDDIRTQMEYERGHALRAKSYEQHAHDIVLWHFVQGRRPTAIESPVEATYWIVTLDYRFMAFDRFKTARTANIPVCVHPTTVVQLLQFWVPRDDRLEIALFNSMNLRTTFYEFDPESERATVKILQTLSRFENVADLSSPTVTAILLNDALRDRISATSSDDQEIELVREALIEEHRRTQTLVEQKTGEANQLRNELGMRDEQLANLQKAIDQRDREIAQSSDRIASTENLVRQLQQQIQSEQERRAEAESDRLEKDRLAREGQEHRRLLSQARHRSAWALLFIVVSVGAAIWSVNKWCDGANCLQRLSNGWSIVGGAFAASTFVGCLVIGKQRFHLLGEWLRRLLGGGG